MPSFFCCEHFQHIRDFPLAATTARERTRPPRDCLCIEALIKERSDLCARGSTAHTNHLILINNFIFAHKKKFYIQIRYPSNNSFRRIFKASNLHDVQMHTLRHTNASRLVQNGMSVYDAKEILGQTNIQTTLKYAHLERRDITQKAKDVLNTLNLHTSLTT